MSKFVALLRAVNVGGTGELACQSSGPLAGYPEPWRAEAGTGRGRGSHA